MHTKSRAHGLITANLILCYILIYFLANMLPFKCMQVGLLLRLVNEVIFSN